MIQPARLEWRVDRVPARLVRARHYWRKKLNSGGALDIPAEVFTAPGEYRVRAPWRDDTGRCSHWSTPVTVIVP